MLPCSFCSLGSVGDWISTEGAPCVCPHYSCNSSGKTKASYSRAVLILYIQVSNVKKHTGNLDCVSLCCSCFNGDIRLLETPLLYLVLLKLCSTRRFNRSDQFCKLGKFQIFFLLNYILDGSYSHCWITILACSLDFLFSVLIILWVNFALVNNVKVIHIL